MKPLGQGECWSEEVPVLKGSLKSHTSKKKKKKKKKKRKNPILQVTEVRPFAGKPQRLGTIVYRTAGGFLRP